MPRVTFTEANTRERRFIDAPGTYALTVVSVEEQFKNGNEVWKVYFSSEEGFSHSENFEFAESWYPKLHSFLRSIFSSLEFGEQNIDSQMTIGATASAEIIMVPDKADKNKLWPRVKRWIPVHLKSAGGSPQQYTSPSLRRL
jgi:hypothetical protein